MLAITHGTIYTANNGIIYNGTIIIDNGIITAVGQDIAIPSHAGVIDASGKIITPGFIDSHTHLGIAAEAAGTARLDKNEVNSPVCPHLRAIDGIDPEDAGMSDAARAGVTSVVVTPGSENVIGGQSVALKTVGLVVDQMILREPAGLKVAFGENPIKIYLSKDRAPSTRMTVAGLIRENLVAAQNYRQKIQLGQAERDLRLEALVKVLNREIPLRAHAHAADDIMTAVRIADEFNVLLTIEHATSAHKIADELAKRGIPAIVGPSITARVKVELKDRTYTTPALLHKAGVKIALTTDHPFLPIGSLRLEAALAIKEGLPRDAALRALTIHPAEIAGIDARVGSIEPGKDGDLIIFNGDPFDIASEVEQVFINGKPVYGA
ncbi:MAG: amidohydrolase [Negativicutes bacterium]|nr:amidohydrolase [Negativicutes bacterium]